VAPPLLDARSRAQAEARRLAAAAYLERAQAADAFATNELRRFEKLFQEKGVSLQELEAVQWREAAARKEKAAAESALRQAEAELAEFNPGGAPEPGAPPKPTEVRAPAQGRVLRVFEESARVVAPGTPLLELGDPGDLEVVIEVLSSDGAAITAGMRVLFEQWGGGQPLEGQVRLVEPSAFTKVSALGVEEQRVNVVADLLTPAAQRAALGDNFRVEARIIVWEDAQTLKVPAGALFRQGDSWAAFVVSEGRAHRRLVRTGRAGGTETQVTAGLQASEQIILYPGDRVRDGQRVRRIQL
jgi:HlyD family secretion protein